ncbi:MAG TPA: class I SAM-dependent methyltransferase [Thermohalobaculum sp.]|nr:class I SAM-dependent methyltransferase [Thermohalobaculum sp.]
MIPRPGVAAVSAAILAYEVLLVRLFSIVHWHHFAFMAISVALLGFGISGAILAVLRPWFAARARGAFTAAAALFGVTAPLAFLVAQRLPFNALEVVWAPGQLLWLGAIYLALAVPFTAGATCIGLAFVEAGTAAGRVYFWNLLGSGAGALGIVGALFVLGPMACLGVAGGLGLVAAVLGARHPARAAGAAGLAVLAWFAAPPGWTALHISEFKGLTRALAVSEARLAAERSGPLALLSVVESPAVPFRHAPGLSLTAPALPPPQLGVFADGAFAAAIDQWDGERASLGYLDHTTDALPYHLTEPRRVLVLGAGGGRGVLQALGHGAGRVDAVEPNPDMIRLLAHDFAGRAGAPYARPGVRVHAAEPRHFVEAPPGVWNVIQLSLGGGPGGLHGLSEDYLLTVEGLTRVYRSLGPGGWLSVTAPIDLPPRAGLKLAATLAGALEGLRVEDPGTRIIAMRGMSTLTIAVKRGLVLAPDITAARAFAATRAFDLVHYPGMQRAEANRRNVLAGPVFHEGLRALLGPGRGAFVAGYKFDIAPPTDDRPYFHDFFRWATLPELLSLGAAGGGAALLDLGELIVAATLVQAGLLGLALVLLPLRARAYRGKPGGTTWRFGIYFAALGLAFLFVEIAWIQRFTLFLGHPLYAVSVVLTGFLVFAGLGAGASLWLDRRRWPSIGLAVGAIAALALGYLAALPGLFAALAHLSDPARVAVSLALIAPLAFFMGMPFPLGLARVARTDPAYVPWAWGLNGCASVVSTPAATLISMQLGNAATVVAAVGLYAAAALALRGPIQPRGPGD